MDEGLSSRRCRGRRAAILLALGAIAVPRPVLAAEPVLAVLPIKLLDTSAEPTDQQAAHAKRLTSLGADLASGIEAAGLYRTRPVSAADVRAACPGEAPDCLLASVRAAGAGFAFIGVVHKSSTLIMQMWARIVDARSGKTLFSRELNFRGDTDESWRRATDFLIAQIRSDPPRPVP